MLVHTVFMYFFIQSPNKVKENSDEIPMWKKLTVTSKVSPNNNDPSEENFEKNIDTSSSNFDNAVIVPLKKRPDPVIRASNSVSNQDFLALAVMEGNVSKLQSVVEAYSTLLGIFYYYYSDIK